MRRKSGYCRYLLLLVGLFSLLTTVSLLAKTAEDDPILGPHSTQALGAKKVLMVPVRFPDASPSVPHEQLKRRVVNGFKSYVEEQSYGLASLQADFRQYVTLPSPLSEYKVSPYNFQVDRGRVRKLIVDTMTALEKDVDFSKYDHILIIPAVHTMPAKGYGMICYCANPGMLSGVGRRFVPRYETLTSKGGKEFQGGVFVGAENAHLGMFAHDYFHALAGLYKDKRLAP
jgi:hypothetical protein